jgi:anti-anti-sigma factor
MSESPARARTESAVLDAPERLDAAHAEALERQLEEVVRAGCYEVAFSLNRTTFLSSAGVRALLLGSQKLRRLGGTLRLIHAPEPIRRVLELSGLADLLAEAGASAPGPRADEPSVRRGEADGIRFEVETLSAAEPVAVRFLGRATRGNKPMDPGALAPWRLAPDACGVGLGALGARDAGLEARVGEWLVVSGVAVALPPDSAAADYLAAAPGYQPECQLLYAAWFPDRWTRAARFRPVSDAGFVTLASLLNAALDWTGADRLGVLFAAESAGLVGAAAIRSPLAAGPADPFGFPSVRECLAFTPEPEHHGELALAVGFVCRGEPSPAWSDWVRPLASQPSLYGHLHAAILSPAALPAGRPEPRAFVRRLLERQRVRTLLHLLNDDRPLGGASESRFGAGLLWACPLAADPAGGSP